jgi:DNA-binding MarR family transcriptional regulator
MATQMHPGDRSRVFAAATDGESLEGLKRLELTVLEEGHIGGLNGVLLGAAAEAGLPGACLLGEMPHVFAQIPFPKASLAILEVFATMTGLELDFTELAEQAQITKQSAGFLVDQLEKAGYVHRTADPRDARARLVRISPRGAASIPIAAAVVAQVEAEWTAHLGQRRMAHMRESLAMLCEITDPYR